MRASSNSKDTTHPTAVLAIILVSYLMIVLDISITSTGLPKIQQELNFSAIGLSWVQNAYTLALGGLLLLGARKGDIVGKRRMFMVGITIFTLASLSVGLVVNALKCGCCPLQVLVAKSKTMLMLSLNALNCKPEN